MNHTQSSLQILESHADYCATFIHMQSSVQLSFTRSSV